MSMFCIHTPSWKISVQGAHYLHTIYNIYTLSTISTQAVLEGLSARGHKLARQDSFSSVVVGVQRAEDGRIYANTDFRKAGAVDGF